jgi:hypothetical protein
VATNYIEAEGYATESVDFTSPSGYKELCIVVNEQEECGFGQASTSFAVNYVADEYVKKQATEFNITGEKECVSGSFNWMNLLNPNLQEGLDNLVDPQIYNKGVIRICSNEDPGLGSEGSSDSPDSRWKDVGYCGNQDIRCWIDMSSLEGIFEFEYTQDQTIEELKNDTVAKLDASEKYMDFSQFKIFADEIEKEENPFKKIRLLTEALDKVYMGNQKGWIYLIRGKTYGKLATEVYIPPQQAISPRLFWLSLSAGFLFQIHFQGQTAEHHHQRASHAVFCPSPV